MQNNLVLGFDSWVGGVHNFKRLHSSFSAVGLDFCLLHIGSWGGDPGRPKEELCEGMLIRDISYYEGLWLYDILKKERPCAVIFLSNDVFVHRAVNRYCKALKIPTIHLYHGLVGIQPIDSDRMYKINPYNQIIQVLNKLPKAVTKVWPLYAHSLYKNNAKVHEWIRFGADILNLAIGKYIPIAAEDSRTNACAVYTRADVNHAIKKYGYSKDNIHVVGNPDLSKFNLSDEMLGCAIAASRDTNNEIVYIDTGLIYAGMIFSGPDDFLSHLTGLAKALTDQKMKLTIKLHPDHYRTNLPSKISRSGIRVLDDSEFVASLLKCRASMVEPSSAALIPALLGVPVLMSAFGKLKNQRYGEILMGYPRSCLITELEMADITTSIANILERDPSDIPAWIKRNSGPLPADEMPVRVAKILRALIEH